ncbi:RNA methyltransferase [Roseomonas xinghualingensis]|uniref:RNA methyltransferase n=1 Tax=Roseomonas xinghualingensis TaxID=2986475 RepID=UPI0021F17F8C|nr:RNA methyltransferase [Roseomonas sp. SXEYE001]MCV4209348.1 RNA methyltransferase [Roseomonas sp. SXEYE001]
MMERRGYAAVGLHMPKRAENVGSALRAADCYGAAMVAISGRRYVRSAADTPKAWKHLPVLHDLQNLFDVVPYDAETVAVDLVEGAVPLPTFRHPERAFYVFGPEDGTLGKSVLARCSRRVMVPTRHCMNLAATVNVILYDRLSKSVRGQV